MKIRDGLVLAMALGLGLAGCASGGGGGGGGGNGGGGLAAALAAAGGEEGAPPVETEFTEQAEDFIEAAEEAEEAGNPGQAQTSYQSALDAAESEIQQNPENPLGYRLGALAALGLEDYQKSGEYFDRAGELNLMFDFQDAQLREQTWIDLYNEAMPLVNEGEYEAAAVVFEDANAIYGDRPEAFVTLAQLYGQLRQHDEALENIDRAEEVIQEGVDSGEVDPETLAAWQEQAATLPMLRAQILSDAGRFEEASEVFSQMLQEDPNNVEVARNLAATQLQMGDDSAAFATYEGLLGNPNLEAPDLYQIGIGFYQGSAYERAAQAFSQAVEQNPMDRDGLEMWARSLQLDSAYAEVPPVAERWIELDPYGQNAYLILAQSVNQLGESQRAGEAVQQVESLEFAVNELQMMRYPDGGARVSGTVQNKTLQQGDQVTLTFTFYSYDGQPLGTVTETVTVGGEGMSELFQIEYESTQPVGGYGYEASIG